MEFAHHVALLTDFWPTSMRKLHIHPCLPLFSLQCAQGMSWVILDCKTCIHLKDFIPKQTKCNLLLHYQGCLSWPTLSKKYPVHPFSLRGKKRKDSRPWKVWWLLIEEQIWIIRSMWHKLTVCFLLKEEQTTMGFKTSVVLEQYLPSSSHWKVCNQTPELSFLE